MLKGMICLFFGLISAIPDGWFLCDGNNDTPDLRNRFVVGAGDTYNPGDSAGGAHGHAFTSNIHSHTLHAPGTDVKGLVVGWNGFYDPVTASGTTDSDPATPPYYALSYIMKEG